MDVYVNLLQDDGATKTVKVHLTMANIFPTTTDPADSANEEDDEKEEAATGKNFNVKSKQVGRELAGIDILSDFCKFCTYLAFKLIDDSKNNSDAERDGELRTAAVETANTMSVMLPGGCGGPISPGEVPAIQLSTALGPVSSKGKMIPTGNSLYAPHILPPELQDSQYWRSLLINPSFMERNSGSLYHTEVYLLPWRKVVLNPVADLMSLLTGWMPTQLDPTKVAAGAKGTTAGGGRDSALITGGASPQLGTAASPEMLAKLASSIDGKGGTVLMGSGLQQEEEERRRAATRRSTTLVGAAGVGQVDVTASYATKAQIDEANKILMGIMALDLETVPAATATTTAQQQQPSGRGSGNGAANVGNKATTSTTKDAQTTSASHPSGGVSFGVRLPQLLGRKTSFTDETVDVGPTALSSVTISKSLLCSVSKKIPYPQEVGYMSCCGAFGIKKCLVVSRVVSGSAGAGDSGAGGEQHRNSAGGVTAAAGGGSPMQQNSTSNPASPTVNTNTTNTSSTISYHCAVCGETLNSAEDPTKLHDAPAQAIKISNAVKAFLTAHSKDKDPATLIMMPGSGSSALSNIAGGSSFSTTSGGGTGRGTTIAPPPGFNRPPLPSQVTTSHHHHHHHHSNTNTSGSHYHHGGGVLSSPRSPVQAVMSHPPSQQGLVSPGILGTGGGGGGGFHSPMGLMATGGGSGVLGGSPMLPSPLGGGSGAAGGPSGPGGGFNTIGSSPVMGGVAAAGGGGGGGGGGTAPLIPPPQQQLDPGLLRPEAEGAPPTNRRRTE